MTPYLLPLSLLSGVAVAAALGIAWDLRTACRRRPTLLRDVASKDRAAALVSYHVHVQDSSNG